ncbi:protein CLP1 homolog [Caerostris extrusa]|uniref:Protein CLP1 homolog n=1 Tax=Caerostris extrusa TaxID=172846 RepID=A0AAV4MU82_CAEEX|nr:protein CLP1 homolog [Caerostris extrusa]
MDNVQIINLQANKEGKIQIRNPSDVVHVELLSGTAEIFGVEMIKNKIYPFSSAFAVSTLNGCTLKLKGKIQWTYTVNYNHTIIDLHLSLEKKRKLAEKSGVRGPTVLIAGPTDVGKSTLCRTLLNYAVRSGRIPVYIDLDVWPKLNFHTWYNQYSSC